MQNNTSRFLQKKRALSLLGGLFITASVFGQNLTVTGTVSKHSKKCTFYTLRFGCSFAAVNTIKPQLL